MKITIIDGQVGFNGVFRPVIDGAGLLNGIHAIQFDTLLGKGVVEKDDLSNEEITDISPFQSLLDAWTAAATTSVTVAPKTLDELKADKSKQIDDLCASACTDGFVSSALGSSYLYPSKVLDQQNLIANVTDSLLSHPSDWTTDQVCQDLSTGEWAYRPHTAAQIQQAGSDVKTGILALLVKNSGLQNQIVAAGTQADLDAVVW